MNRIGWCETTGGPVCIAPLNKLRDWAGVDGDYDILFSIRTTRIIDIVKNVAGADYLIFNTETGNFSVYQNDDSLAVFETVYSDNENPGDGVDFTAYVSDPAIRELARFGGTVVIFDSAIPGKHIHQTALGSHRSIPLRHYTVPDLAIAEIPVGHWELLAFAYQTDTTYLRGVLFKHMPVGAEQEIP